MHEIVKTILKVLPKSEELITKLPWEEKEFYAQYLAQTFFYVSHSVKLLKYALERTKDAKLKQHLAQHINEETGHEKWALSDLKNLGYDIKNFSELPSTQNLYSSIYEGIDRDGALAIVGYAMALESISASKGPEIGNRLKSTWGAKCSSFVASHGDKDQGHNQENIQLLDFFSNQDSHKLEKYVVDSLQHFNDFLLGVWHFSRTRSSKSA